MKQLISLMLIILVTVTSWSSGARNKAINVTTIYSLPYLVAPSSILTSGLTIPETEDSLSFPQAKIVSERNRFFELSIIFNEKLQQVIYLLTRSDDKKNTIANNSFLSYTDNPSTVNACNKNS